MMRVAIADHVDQIVVAIALEEPLRLADEPDGIRHGVAGFDVNGSGVDAQVIAEAVDIVRLGLPAFA